MHAVCCDTLTSLALVMHILPTIVKSTMIVRAYTLRGMKRSRCGEIVAHFFNVSLKFRASILEPGNHLRVREIQHFRELVPVLRREIFLVEKASF